MGAIAATTALVDAFSAISLAELPSTHPPQPKPMTRVATAPTATPCNSRVSDSPRYHTEFCMTCPPIAGRKDSSPPGSRATNSEGRRLSAASRPWSFRSIVHSAHAAAGHGGRAILLRRLGDHRFGRDHEASDRSRILQGDPHDLRRIDNADVQHVDIL